MIICLICSIIIGFFLALYVVVKRIKDTNDAGDSTADIKEFGQGSLQMLAAEDSRLR